MLTKIIFTTLLIPVMASGQAVMMANCGDPYDSGRAGGFGPYDVNDRTIPEKIEIVEVHHFTPWIEEMAINGSTARQATVPEEVPGELHGNLDYTLRALPNHARALNAMGMYQLRLRRESMSDFNRLLAHGQTNGTLKTAECYFERAIMFRPDDGMVYMASGVFRHRQGELDLAVENYKSAIRLMPESPEPHYNIGLLYVELEEFELAREHAKRAYELGYPLPGLRNALARRGWWEDIDANSGVDP